MSEANVSSQCGWMKLYHPSGALVTLPVPCNISIPDSERKAGENPYIASFRAVSDAISAGFLVTAPGLEAGETRQEIGYVVRRSKDDERSGNPIPILDLYPSNDAAKFAILTVYINNDEQAAAFEAASGLKIERIPLYIGDNKIERGKKKETDKLVIKAPRPFGVVYTANPKYDAKEAETAAQAGKMYPVPKRKFVRWADEQPTANGKVDTTSTVVDEVILKKWQQFVDTQPDADQLNAYIPEGKSIECKHTRRACWQLVYEYAKSQGIEWNPGEQKFVPPVDVQQEDTDVIPF